jgi:hypothetical protein
MNTKHTRTLKIELVGDFFRHRTVPRIRLAGLWLQKAGFNPGNRVEIKFIAPGTMTLRAVETNTQGVTP